MITRRQEIRNTALLRESIDQRDVAHHELSGDGAVLYGVATLPDEPDRVRGAVESLHARQHRLDHELVFGLELHSIVASAGVAVGNEGKPRGASRRCFGRERRSRWRDRDDRITRERPRDMRPRVTEQ